MKGGEDMSMPNIISIGMSTVILVVVVALGFGENSSPVKAGKPTVYHVGSKSAIDLCRKGVGLLENDEDQFIKANALIERAWELQSSYPQISPDIWRMTLALLKKEKASSRIALLAVYLQSVDDAVESSGNLSEFEATWAVRQGVLGRLKKEQAARANELNDSVKQLARLVAEQGVSNAFSERGSEWADIALEISAMQDSAVNIAAFTYSNINDVQKSIDRWFKNRLDLIDSKLKDLKGNSAASDSVESQETRPANQGLQEEGPYTQLLRKLNDDVQLRNLSAVVSWLSLANSGDESSDDESTDIKAEAYIASVQKLQLKLIEARNLQYNLWALDACYKAESRGGSGLRYLGEINTRLLTSAVAASYSVAESKLLTQLRANPSNYQTQIRTMLRTPKRSIDKF